MNLKLEKILLLILFFGVFNTINASNVKWKYDFDKAHQESIKQKKHLMVLLIKKDSIVGKETLMSSFMNQPYIDKINEKFISILVIKGQKHSYPIELLYTFTYPSLFFLDEYELFSCEPIRGDITPQRIISKLNQCQ